MKLKDRIKEFRRVPAHELQPNPKNWRTHPVAQQDALRGVLAEVGIAGAVLARETAEGGLMLIDGHLRTDVMHDQEIPVLVLDVDEAEADKLLATIDPLAAMAEADAGKLDELLREIDTGSEALQEMLAKLAEDAGVLDGLQEGDDPDQGATLKLADRFGVPPFSVLNARDGWWQERKRAWLSLGIESETGRGKGLTYAKGRDINDPSIDPVSKKLLQQSDGTSIFDPVLCELAYSWFSPEDGCIVDPFAGGSVRGVVASKLGRRYVGHELRGEQVAANREQAQKICGDAESGPMWVEGDSRTIDKTCKEVRADMLFTCPPYADLEVYSDDPADLSNMSYADFVKTYREIIAKTCSLLVEDSFAVCVVGEVRDKKGSYINFVGDTIQAFRDAGLSYYNEAILVTAVGSLPIRVGKQFSASRKLGKTHQNVLVFVKGDGKRAAQRCGQCEFGDITEDGQNGINDE